MPLTRRPDLMVPACQGSSHPQPSGVLHAEEQRAQQKLARVEFRVEGLGLRLGGVAVGVQCLEVLSKKGCNAGLGFRVRGKQRTQMIQSQYNFTVIGCVFPAI